MRPMRSFVTDMKDTLAAIETATARFGAERVLVPALLDVRGSNAKRSCGHDDDQTHHPRWYMWCRPTSIRRTGKAAADLLRQGYEVYLPRYLKRRRHARRVENVPAPLFPRYLFVGFDAAARWRSIQSTQGVSHLVCNSSEPADPAAAREWSELRRREDDKGFIRLDLQPQYAPGDKIRVVDGVFSDSVGSFERMTDRDRVAILLDLLGRKVRIVLDRESVAAA